MMSTIVYIPGTCRVCGCTELSPCILAADEAAVGLHALTGAQINDEPGILSQCSWVDRGHTLCSNLHCIAQVPLDELIELFAPPHAVTSAHKKSAAAGGGRAR